MIKFFENVATAGGDQEMIRVGGDQEMIRVGGDQEMIRASVGTLAL